MQKNISYALFICALATMAVQIYVNGRWLQWIFIVFLGSSLTLIAFPRRK
jgi:hypothetical protein